MRDLLHRVIQSVSSKCEIFLFWILCEFKVHYLSHFTP